MINLSVKPSDFKVTAGCLQQTRSMGVCSLIVPSRCLAGQVLNYVRTTKKDATGLGAHRDQPKYGEVRVT